MNLKGGAGMSWFGNICRQFELVCQDTDEVVNHDSIKYIERKVQNVGENVMKFYSKLAEIIVSPIMGPDINQEEDDAAVTSDFKSLMGNDEHFDNTLSTVEHVIFEPVKNQLVHESNGSEESAYEESDYEESESEECDSDEGASEESDSEECGSDESASDEKCDSEESDSEESASEECDSEESDSEESDSETSASECFSSASCALYTSSASMQIPANVASSTLNSSETIPEIGRYMLPNEAFTIYCNAIKSSISVTALHHDANEIIKWFCEYSTSKSYGNCSPSMAPSMESSGPSDNSSCETTDLDKEAKNLSHQVELEESCVLVDYSTPHDDVSYEAPKQTSYKEKILDAFSSKKMLAREYKELAILHATECCQGTSSPAPHSMLLRDSQTIQLSDSEWELL